MRTITLLSLTLFLAAASTHAHTVKPGLLEFWHLGEALTFRVADEGNCSADLIARVADESIASVSPEGASAVVEQIFQVVALKDGETKIRIQWSATNCNDTGSGEVNVIVHSGPDLVIEERTSPALRPYKPIVRVGGTFTFDYRIRNFGDRVSSGPFTLASTMPAGFAIKDTSTTCPGTYGGGGNTYQCQLPDTIEVLGTLPVGRTPRIRVEAAEVGLFSHVAELTGGGDVRLTNNSSSPVIVEVFEPRESGQVQTPAPVPVRGRR